MNQSTQPNIPLIAEDEEFKTVKIYDEYYDNYLISNYGRVYSLNCNRIIYHKVDKWGYTNFKLHKNGKVKYISGQRLVAFAFVSKSNPEYNTVNHIDENPKNNYYKNLEWCDCEHNLNHGSTQKRRAAKRSKAVIQYDLNHDFVAIYQSLPEASKNNNISITQIFNGCHDGKAHSGYYWRYTSDLKEGETL